MKKIRILLCLCICMFFNVGFDYSKEKQIDEENINPKYLEYEKLTDEQKAKASIIPKKYINYYNSDKKAFKKGTFSYTILPDTFDLRDVDGENYVAPIDNQGSTDLCWAFSANNSLESNMLMKSMGSHNFSERQLDYALSEDGIIGGNNLWGWDRDLLDGGNNAMVALTWFEGFSPVTETIFGAFNESVTPKAASEVLSYDNVEYDVTSTVDFPSLDLSDVVGTEEQVQAALEEYNEIIKTHLTQYGAISSSVYWDFYDSTANLLYNDGTANYYDYYDSGHAVTIIGWDDTYGDIDSDGIGDGAWLVQNSWGSTRDYYYVSYYDVDIVSDMMGVKEVKQKTWDNMYLQAITGYDYVDDNTRIYEYVKDSSTEELESIKFNVTEGTINGNEVNLYIRKDGETDFTSLGTFNVTVGLNTITPNDIILDGDFEIIVNTTAEYDMNVTTKNVESITPSLTIYTLYHFDISTSQDLELAILTKGIDNGEVLDFKIVDENNLDITSKFNIVSTPAMNNLVTVNFGLDDDETLDIFDFTVIVSYGQLTANKNIFVYYFDGEGTEEDPYLIGYEYALSKIKTGKDGNTVLCYKNTKYFKLTDNIDLIDGESEYQNALCNAVVDGNGYTIYGIDAEGGLFSNVENVEIKNLNIDYSSVTSESETLDDLGVVVNHGLNSKFSNIHIGPNTKIHVTGDGTKVGCIAGYIENSSIQDSYCEATIISNADSSLVGGIVSTAVFDLESLDSSNDFGTVIKNNYFNGTLAVAKNITGISNFTEYTHGIANLLKFKNITGEASNPENYGITIENNYFNNTEIVDDNDAYYYPTVAVGETEIATSVTDPELAILTNTNNLKKTSAEMLLEETYTGFDFTNTWSITANKTPMLKAIRVITPPTSLVIAEMDLNYFVGESIWFELITEPENYTDVFWNVSNKNILSVSVKYSDELATYATAAGTTQVCATSLDGSKTSCKTIQVKELKVLVGEDYEVDETNKYVYLEELLTPSSITSNINYQSNAIEIEKASDSSYAGTGSVISVCANSYVCKDYEIIVQGDTNGDGEVDIYDIIDIRKNILNISYISGGPNIIAADYEEDDEIDIYDIIKVRKKILGIAG